MIRNSKGFTPILILLVIVVIGFVGYFAYKDYLNSSHVSNYPVSEITSLFSPTPAPSPYSSAPTPVTSPKISWNGLPAVMKDVWNLNITTANDKKLNFSDPYSGWYWWISDDNWNINGSSDEISIFVPNKSDIDTNIPLEPDEIKIAGLINNQFIKDGWVFNTKNSSKSVDSGEFYDYVQAYTKDGWKCLVVTDGDISGNSKDGWIRDIRVSCFDSVEFQKDYQEQEPILFDLGDHEDIITLGEIINNYMLLGEHGRRAGGILVIKKENGKWVTITSGQPPLCSDIQKYNIPKGILDGNCGNY